MLYSVNCVYIVKTNISSFRSRTYRLIDGNTCTEIVIIHDAGRFCRTLVVTPEAGSYTKTFGLESIVNGNPIPCMRL